MSDGLLSNICPNCFAQPGKRCTIPTETGRVEVIREHYARRDGRGEAVTDNKCDNPPKSIPEDQVDAISVIDKTLDNLELLDADWTAPEVVELLQDLRDRIVRGYVTPQEPQPGKRIDPEFRAQLVDIAKGSIQDVWDDVPGGVDAETLAQNVVGSQEFAWISRGFPVAPQEPSEWEHRVIGGEDLETVFTVKCAGGCGRESKTMRVSELWTPQYCPDCQAEL